MSGRPLAALLALVPPLILCSAGMIPLLLRFAAMS